MRIIENLSDISQNYDAVFCDLWGCLHNGVTAFPDAVEALRAYKAQGGIVILLTNSPKPKSHVIPQLDSLNVPSDCWDDIATSGDSAQAAMVSGQFGQKVFHMGPERDLPFFTDLAEDLTSETDISRTDLESAEGIIATGLVNDETETPEDYRAQLLYAKTNGMKMLCANPDVVVDRGDKRVYCAGALAQLYAEMGGEVSFVGKPHPPIYDLARRRLSAIRNIPEDRILAIGDGPATDVKGALGEDLDCLFITGGLAAEATGTNTQPDPAKLEQFLEQEKLAPTFSIGFLR
ncbi:MAG: TIGR01459 family HAD-type hydrolase [Mangrovicoccus sp.]